MDDSDTDGWNPPGLGMAMGVLSGASSDTGKIPDLISPEKWPALFEIPCDKLANARFVVVSSFFDESLHKHVPFVILHTKDKKTFIIDKPVTKGVDPLFEVQELSGVGLRQAVFTLAANTPSIIVLTDDGLLLSTGDNTHGQLGHDGTAAQKTFSLVRGLPFKIQMIAAGEGHVLALAENNQVYAWGKNDRGQLGIGEIGAERDSPRKVFPTEDSAGEGAAHVACGSQHSALLTTSGKVLLCGESQYGVRGDGQEGAVSSFSPVPGLEMGKYKQVCCGGRHTMALRDDGVMFSWGGNRFGQLGLGKEAGKYVTTPTRVATSEESSDCEDEPRPKMSDKDEETKEKIIQSIHCARVTCVAVAEDTSRLVWGRWKGEAVGVPRVIGETSPPADALATGSWGPETGGCVPVGDAVFGFWRLAWLGDLPLRFFLTFGRRPSDYNPWTILLEQVAQLVKDGGDGLLSRDDDGGTALHCVAKYKYHSGKVGDPEAKMKDKAITTALEALVNAGVDVNARDSLGNSPLYDAIARDNDVAVKLLLSLKDTDIQSSDTKGRSPLHVAAKFNRLELVPVLLAAGADITASAKNGMRPIHQAVRKDFVPMVKLLNERASVAFPSMILRDKIKSGKTAIDVALYGECWDAVRWLLENVSGAPINVYNQEGIPTALHMAAEAGHADLVEGLLHAHPDLLDMQDERGATALHLAAKDDIVSVAESLIQEGANTEARDKQRLTPTQVSIINGNIETLKVLIDSGASTDVLTKDNETVLHLAVKNGDLGMLTVVYNYVWEQGMDDQMLLSTTKLNGDSPLHYAVRAGKRDMVLYLLTKSAAISKKNKKKRNAFHIAASNGETEIVKELLAAVKKRDIINLVMRGDREGWTPLHHAAHHGHAETTKAIVRTYDRFTDNIDNQHWTAMFYAAEHGHVDAMEVLLKANADIKLRDQKQRTALHLAASAGQAEAVMVLLKAGASPKAVNEHGQNVLDIAIAEKHEHVVAAVIQSDLWHEALDHQTNLNTGTGVLITTPFRTLVRIMPDLAEKVMDKCITLSEIPHKHDEHHHHIIQKKKKIKPKMMLKFDFKYLDEQIHPPCSGHHHHDHKSSEDKDKATSSKSSSMDSMALLDEQAAHNHSHCNKQPRKSIVHLKPQLDKPVLEVMAASKRTLKHPLVRALLEKKWKTTRYFVLSFLLFYAAFVLTLSLYLMLSFPANAVNATLIADHDSCEKATEELMEIGMDMWVIVPHKTLPLSITVMVLAVFGIILEFIQIALMRHGLLIYLKNYSTNFLDWFAYVSAICVALPVHPCHLRLPWQWQLSVLSVMSAWMNLILFLRRLPVIGIYLLMILEMVQTLVLCLLGCLPIILTFVVSFVILHQNQTPFSNPVYSFFKIIVMMIGELDFGDQFYPDDDAEKPGMPVLAYIVYLCFLVVVTTVIMNLVTGIAVTAMEAIQNEAEEQKLILQVNLTLDVECALPNRLRQLFKWNALEAELKIKDEHLKKMPLYLRNKILYGKEQKATCGHHAHAKDTRMNVADILLISNVMFPGAQSHEEDEEPLEDRSQTAIQALTDKVASLAEKIDRVDGERSCLSTVELQLQRLEQTLNVVVQGQGQGQGQDQ